LRYLSVPSNALSTCIKRNKPCWHGPLLADLLTIAFFFLRRPGEYIMPTTKTKIRTVQFRRKNVRFFKDGTMWVYPLLANDGSGLATTLVL
jgi:hypothetical protein